MSDDYRAFLDAKAVRAPMRGLSEVPPLAKHLFPFQRACVDFALRAGSAGIYLDTGLGKTEIQLEWCNHAAEATNGHALILTPLGVAGQTNRRAAKWGYRAKIIREMGDIEPGINIINYDRLHLLDPSAFGAVALDESSILKSFTGKTTRALIEMWAGHRFRLAATATPAPNDHMEIGQQSEFLGVMPSNEMLMRWFIADQTNMGHYRLKGYAINDFWDWMASWSRMAVLPSDLGDYSDDGYVLPPFKVIRHKVSGEIPRKSGADGGDLFGTLAVSATNMHVIKRETAAWRAGLVSELVRAEPNEPWILWCDTDYEADALQDAVPEAVEVRGSMAVEKKEDRIEAFGSGRARVLIGKPSMLGFGLDWSHCANMAFAGRSFSYETWYQAVRRCWRFGQRRTLKVHLAVAEGEDQIGRVIDRKAEDDVKMKAAMRAAMRRAQGASARKRISYNPTHVAEAPSWLKSVA